jgi:hypothetical protein
MKRTLKFFLEQMRARFLSYLPLVVLPRPGGSADPTPMLSAAAALYLLHD